MSNYFYDYQLHCKLPYCNDRDHKTTAAIWLLIINKLEIHYKIHKIKIFIKIFNLQVDSRYLFIYLMSKSPKQNETDFLKLAKNGSSVEEAQIDVYLD